ncbi:hypothetical protein [Actinacidiphila oryziradicis]|uniref:Uncharacterized protein n=1 Tax=Actinacidiphila oryziradicis TaxID=2571141 RepID=A0A4U0SER5_9ACTN|nr:hypothetical protein [Actinacidiphila oryziradicis]TKA06657.1 hypothetical protein FCI23_30175 [Actinacidiphila oryziradicis]
MFSTADLSADGRYGSAAYPNAVAIADDGTVAGGIDGSSEPDIYLYEPGNSSAFREYELGTNLESAGLA